MRALLLSMLLVGVAHGDAGTAARAFANGQAAQLEGDFDRAAQSFELAFSIAPTKEALRSAVRARQQAGQLARAGTLAALLLEKYSADPASAKLANEVVTEALTKFGRVSINCTAPCTVAIDGRAISLATGATHVVFASPGKQTLTVTFDGTRDVTADVVVAVGATIDVPVEPPAVVVPAPTPTPPPPAPTEKPVVHAKPAPEPSGLSPAVVIVGSVIAVGLAGAGVWSGLDTNDAHDAYVANPTHAGWEAGRSKQMRTNILFGSAAGVGVATIAVAIFWTRWGSSNTESPSPIAIAPQDGGFGISYGSSF